ncbi:hypothetical protein HY612_02360 [Candidatus Roizmanbacteria bacterium]|nr:hypothetical protein [Candidatus Roizmanbacteria bacterium]
MNNFNKIVSFVLGLIVVIVFLAVITGRFNLKNRIKSLGQKKISPTPTVSVQRYLSPTTIPTGLLGQRNSSNYTPNSKTPTTIPATGSPSLFLPLIFSTFSLGLYLRKKSQKD